MKKTNTFFSVILASLAFFLPACASTESEPKEEFTATNGYVTLEAFESYSTVSRILCATEIGDGRIVKDYKSEGNSAFQITVPKAGTAEGTSGSTFVDVPTYGNVGEYCDFSKVDEIALDVYGVAGSELEISIAAASQAKSTTLGPVQTFEVKNGEWTTVYCSVNRTITSVMMNIEKISDIRLTVSGVDAVVCVDNLRIHTTETDYAKVEVSVDKGEFCNFEKAYQSFMVTAESRTGTLPTLEIVTDPLIATSGSKFLKIHQPVDPINNWVYVTFSEMLFDVSKFDSYDTKNGYFLMDVYKPFEGSFKPALRQESTFGSQKQIQFAMGEDSGWYTVCLPLSSKITGVNKLKFCWKTSMFKDQEADFYIDNMRLVNELPTTAYPKCFVA